LRALSRARNGRIDRAQRRFFRIVGKTAKSAFPHESAAERDDRAKS
jgi:hypothetical protein